MSVEMTDNGGEIDATKSELKEMNSKRTHKKESTRSPRMPGWNTEIEEARTSR